jgi:N-methylhydantoinase B
MPQAQAPTEIDVVTASILAGKLDAVVRDMSTTLANVVHSRQLSTTRLFACALLDEDGQVVAIDAPLHLATLQDTVACCLDKYQFDIASDDVMITNDPYGGGSSVHYLTLVAPLGIEDQTVAYMAIQAHMPDIGGTVMGNYHPTAWELWQEGARFTPLKLVTEGKRRRSAIDTLLLNGRDPVAYRGDLDAVLATANVGRERLASLINTHGLDLIRRGMASSLDYSERRFRAALARLPEGSFSGESTLDHDGQGRRDLTVRVTLRRTGDEVELDFTGTDLQSAGFVNSPRSNTRAYALLAFLGLVDDSVPRNAGLLRALDFKTPEGTLVAPTYPAPTGWCREHVGFEIAEAVGQAIAQALPDEAGVGHASRPLLFSIDKQVLVGGVEEQLGRTDYSQLTQPGQPATAHGDGWGAPGSVSRGLIPSVEEFEAENDMTVERLEYVIDSGGPGRHRGGLATETVIRLAPGGSEVLYACAAGAEHAPTGWRDGSPGAAAALHIEQGGTAAEVDGVEMDRQLADGARLRILASGGGGWGDPREREPARVRADVMAGYVSPEAAQKVYGVDDADDEGEA